MKNNQLYHQMEAVFKEEAVFVSDLRITFNKYSDITSDCMCMCM